MSIRYCSLNEYYTNYVFDIENDIDALKKMNLYVVGEIKAQKHFVDSLKASSYMDNLPKTYKDHQYGTSLSLTASDVYLYTPPNEFSFDQVNDEDLVMVYELNEEQFSIKNIVVGQQYKDSSISITVQTSSKINRRVLKVNNNEFKLETLYQVFNKIKEIKYHTKTDNFVYSIFLGESNVLDIVYKNKGTSLTLDYK
ncbi:hypothetical protein [Aquimarina sp. Aq107]|uniref:hypothetical protein n=1 Tax=Aquimarina sp. Aq107 TaxID=1191912 RepID=UPI000D55722B|nr:hypothetical protein [Aquimarina sp. Aq107]